MPITKSDSDAPNNVANNDKNENNKDNVSIDAANIGGPLPGRVICKEDLVITIDGIDIKQQPTPSSVKSKMEGTRPVIGPKPTGLINKVFFIFLDNILLSLLNIFYS